MRTKRKFRQKGRTSLKSVMERVLKSDKYNFDSDTGLLVHKVKQHKGTFYTSLSGDYHVVRESIFYGIGLMYVNPEKNAPIVSKLIRQVCALEDCDENSRTYGVWPLYMEEPVQTRERPDWNWSDFCAKGLLQFIIDYSGYFEAGLIDEVKHAVVCAARAIKKRDVNPSYTNISVMGSYVTLAAGEYLGDSEMTEYAKGRFKKLFCYNMLNGCVSEYNSPTYTIEALTDLSLIRKHIHDEEIREMTDLLLDMQWKYTMEHFCAENKQWTGPHSRCYETIQGKRLLSFLQVGLGERFRIIEDGDFEPEPMWVQSGMEIPEQYIAYAAVRGIKSFMRHAVLNDEIYVQASMWRNGCRSIGSFSFCDFWTQRRPVIAYWGGEAFPRYMRLRLMHDDFDFTSGLLKTVQADNLVIGSVVLCNDHGDRHFNLDPICHKQISAEYIALRFEIGGRDILKDFEGTEENENGIVLVFRDVLIPIRIGRRAFGDSCPEVKIDKYGQMITVDVVWHSSEQAENVTLEDGKKAFTAFGTGIYSVNEREKLYDTFGRISETQEAITFDSGYSVHTVEYPETIGSYKDNVRHLKSAEKHCVKPSRHVWRVPSREDFGET